MHAIYQEAQKQPPPSRWSGQTRKKMDTVEFHDLKMMRNFFRPNDKADQAV